MLLAFLLDDRSGPLYSRFASAGCSLSQSRIDIRIPEARMLLSRIPNLSERNPTAPESKIKQQRGSDSGLIGAVHTAFLTSGDWTPIIALAFFGRSVIRKKSRHTNTCEAAVHRLSPSGCYATSPACIILKEESFATSSPLYGLPIPLDLVAGLAVFLD